MSIIIAFILTLTIIFYIYLYFFLKKINKEIGNVLSEHIAVMLSVPDRMYEQLKVTDANILDLINKLKVREEKDVKVKSEDRSDMIGLI